jgi:hypothetical protein
MIYISEKSNSGSKVLGGTWALAVLFTMQTDDSLQHAPLMPQG